MIGELICEARRDLGLSQMAFAVHVGAGLSTVQRWERGERVPTSYVHIVALERVGVPLSALRAAATARVAA